MGDMSLPADYPTIPVGVYDEAKLVKLARQIAMGIKDLPDILFDNSLTLREYAEIKELPFYKRTLHSEVTAWAGAENTRDRVSIKAAAMLEEILPELYARLNDREEPMMAKVKALELTAKLAGFTEREGQAAVNPGDKVHVVINLGADMRAEYIKQLPAKVIEHEPAPAVQPTLESLFEESLDVGTN